MFIFFFRTVGDGSERTCTCDRCLRAAGVEGASGSGRSDRGRRRGQASRGGETGRVCAAVHAQSGAWGLWQLRDSEQLCQLPTTEQVAAEFERLPGVSVAGRGWRGRSDSCHAERRKVWHGAEIDLIFWFGHFPK